MRISDFLTSFSLEHPDGRTERRLNTEEKLCILTYIEKHPNLSHTDIALHFSDISGKKIGHKLVQQIIQESFMKELFDKLSLKENLAHVNSKSNPQLRALAVELARNPKYIAYYGKLPFCGRWLTKFRRKFNIDGKNDKYAKVTIKEKQEIIQFMDENPQLTDKAVSQHFSTVFGAEFSPYCVYAVKLKREAILNYKGDLSDLTLKKDSREIDLMQELYDETCCRQSLTNENVTTYDKLHALATELAGHEKYRGFFTNHKFGRRWMRGFRKQFNMEVKGRGSTRWNKAKSDYSEGADESDGDLLFLNFYN